MEVDTGAEAALETDSSSSAFSSSILETAGESDESSQSIFLWKETISEADSTETAQLCQALSALTSSHR